MAHKALEARRAYAREWRRGQRRRLREGRTCGYCAVPLPVTMHGQTRFCSDNCKSIFWNYGITKAQRDAMLVGQDGCAICHTHEPERGLWHIDHDRSCCSGHRSCGECIRGILCPRCNRALGQFSDDPLLLAAAIAYLEVARG